MEVPEGYLQRFAVKRGSERADLIRQFVEKINACRAGTKYKLVEPRVIAVKTAHLNMAELKEFYRSCSEATCPFSQAFYGRLKIK
jgi:hypothetical protein